MTSLEMVDMDTVNPEKDSNFVVDNDNILLQRVEGNFFEA